MNKRSDKQIGTTSSYSRSRRGRSIAIIVGLAVILVVVFLLSVSIGRYGIDLGDLAASFGDSECDGTSFNVLFHLRGPRVVAAAAIGAMLACAGCAYQGLFRNPLVSPDLLGASAGACFGAALGILMGLSGFGMQVLAFASGVAAVSLAYGLSKKLSKAMSGVLVLVLCGLVIQNLFTAFTSAIKFMADPNSQLPEITFWLMGGLANVREDDLLWLAVPLVIGCGGMFAMRWRLNVMSCGDEEAASLGVNVKRTRLVVVACATLATSAAVSVAGMVGWVGLIIPHLARFLVGPDNRFLVPASFLLGGSFLVLVDDVCRSVYTTEVPLSILTAIIGAPLFVYLIYHSRRL
ncbi:MAG: iron ABC transporter permease [Eggerthellaceae bacterium]|nr:iron ABC transporter permease [Eggerthellaceae bacterium]